MNTHTSPPATRQYFVRRTLILGSAVFAASVVSGIAVTFWLESGYSSRLLIQATLGPLYIGVVFLLPITLPVMLVLAIMVFIGSRLRRIWVSALAFVLMGAYWLWLVKLFLEEAFD